MNPSPSTLKIAAVLFPGFELLDVFGPLELFGLLQEKVAITMVAERAGPVRSSQGPVCVAEAALGAIAGFDLLLVPGGRGTRTEVDNPTLLGLLRARAEEAKFVASVCTGSALLAKSGVLDDRSATTNKRAFDWVTLHGPKVRWIRRARWVEDGRFFTSSGVSAGMDMTLGLIAKLFGRETSLEIAHRAEYTWHEDKNHDPFAAGPAESAKG